MSNHQVLTPLALPPLPAKGTLKRTERVVAELERRGVPYRRVPNGSDPEPILNAMAALKGLPRDALGVTVRAPDDEHDELQVDIAGHAWARSIPKPPHPCGAALIQAAWNGRGDGLRWYAGPDDETGVVAAVPDDDLDLFGALANLAAVEPIPAARTGFLYHRKEIWEPEATQAFVELRALAGWPLDDVTFRVRASRSEDDDDDLRVTASRAGFRKRSESLRGNARSSGLDYDVVLAFLNEVLAKVDSTRRVARITSVGGQACEDVEAVSLFVFEPHEAVRLQELGYTWVVPGDDEALGTDVTDDEPQQRTLAAPATLYGFEVPAGSRVTFTAGKATGIEWRKPVAIGSYKVAKYATLEHLNDVAVMVGVLAKKAVIDGRPAGVGDLVWIDAKGEAVRCLRIRTGGDGPPNAEWAVDCRVKVVAWTEGKTEGLAALAEAFPKLVRGRATFVAFDHPERGGLQAPFVKLDAEARSVCLTHSAAAVRALLAAQVAPSHRIEVVTRHFQTCVVWGPPKAVAKFVDGLPPYGGPSALGPCEDCAAIARDVEAWRVRTRAEHMAQLSADMEPTMRDYCERLLDQAFPTVAERLAAEVLFDPEV